ncbi:lysophospholipid acyltransferase family protein [Bdellovibrionota bacterium FG-1]
MSQRIDRAVTDVNSAGFDHWGLDPKTVKATAGALEWLYRKYFRVKTVGIKNIPRGRVLLIANHGGQIPFDGALIALSVLLDGKPPRIARGMVERWFPVLPFISTLFTRCGGMVGDHRNCRLLLENEQCVLVFPEGVKGSGKSIFEAYQLQSFGTGFMRLALETQAPIVPVAVIGCEEVYPGIMNLKRLAKLIGAPYVPITPFFPFLGPLGMLPLPTQVTLRFGAPLRFDVDPEAPDAQIVDLVEKVRDSIAAEIKKGLEDRGGHVFG